MSYLGMCILFLASDLAFSQNICLSENPCECVLNNKTVINLSSVGLPDYPRFSDVSFNPNCSELYSYNPCFPFDSPDKHTITSHEPCTQASACVKGFGGSDGKSPEEHAIGLQNTAHFEAIDGQIYISYKTGSSKVLQVHLECINESSDVHILTMDESNCSDSTDLIKMTLSSPCACPNGCVKTSPKESSSKGLSTGSKLLIAFFTIILAYLIIGIVWNYCNGSHGMELIPNIEFWNGLPTLIMEGVVFTCSCCGRQRSYGEV